MLDGLDAIDWSRSSHAYGDASDVSVGIRGLLDADEDHRRSALEALYSSICHQGSVYPATILARPFLIDILARSENPDRESVASLVASIMAAESHTEAFYRQPRINPFTRQPIEPPPDLAEQISEERRIIAEIHGLGARAVPLLVPFLVDGYPEMRQDIARAISRYPDQRKLVAPALHTALARESVPEVRHEIGLALVRLGDGP